MKPLRFLADIGISPASVAYLRTLGFDAVHLVEQGLQRMSDAEIIDKALKEDRVILTHDLDFGTLMAASSKALPSVVIFRLANMTPTNVNIYLQLLIRDHSEKLRSGAIISISETAIRTRLLPII